MSLEAITWQNRKLEVLDMLLLPHITKYVLIKDTNDGWNAIKNMQVRGAPSIALVGCLSLASEFANKMEHYSTADEVHKITEERLNFLVTARPTAVNMNNAARDLVKFSDSLLKEKLTAKQHIDRIVEWCEKLLEDDIKNNISLGDFGTHDIIQALKDDNKAVVLTHCNTGSLATGGYGTALGVIRSLASRNKLAHVYCTETRPYNQGARLTAYELVYENFPATLICDSMVAALMKEKRIDAVVVGADRTAKNGDSANKIGTLQIAIVAKYHKVPFYVCAPTSTIDFTLEDGSAIPIEERPHKEMTSIGDIQIAASGIGCWNPSFDVTSAELITGGIVTEKGLFKPSELIQLLTV